jgi:hypothetical protein
MNKAVGNDKSLVIACGALAREITTLIDINGWDSMRVQCIPAKVHNTPEVIPDAVREVIRRARAEYRYIYIAFADCGTGGLLDKVIAEEQVERLPGAHCYEFYAGADVFAELEERELGTFYLTDFLARHFERLIIRELGISEHPELQDMYFAHYKKLVYLAQTENSQLLSMAQDAAQRLQLEFEYRLVGYGQLEHGLKQFQSGICGHTAESSHVACNALTEEPLVRWQN